MKKLFSFTTVFLFNVILITGLCFGQDLAEGFWISVDSKTGNPDIGWEIYVIGDVLYGRILSLAGYRSTGRQNVQMPSYFPSSGRE